MNLQMNERTKDKKCMNDESKILLLITNNNKKKNYKTFLNINAKYTQIK